MILRSQYPFSSLVHLCDCKPKFVPTFTIKVNCIKRNYVSIVTFSTSLLLWQVTSSGVPKYRRQTVHKLTERFAFNTDETENLLPQLYRGYTTHRLLREKLTLIMENGEWKKVLIPKYLHHRSTVVYFLYYWYSLNYRTEFELKVKITIYLQSLSWPSIGLWRSHNRNNSIER